MEKLFRISSKDADYRVIGVLNGEKQYFPVKGRLVKVMADGLEDISLFVHKSITSYEKGYVCSELATGLRVDSGKTRDEAVTRAIYTIASRKERFYDVMKKFIEEYGRINW